MMDRLGTSEFAALQHMEQLMPYGERGAWLRNALLCCVLVNIHRDKGQPAAEIDDFMPEALRSKPSADGSDSAKGILAFFEMVEKSQKEEAVSATR